MYKHWWLTCFEEEISELLFLIVLFYIFCLIEDAVKFVEEINMYSTQSEFDIDTSKLALNESLDVKVDA